MRLNKSILLAALLLAACDSLPDWMGNDQAAEKTLPGERVAVLDYTSQLSPDSLIEDNTIRMMQPERNSEHPFEVAAQQLGLENLLVSGFERTASASVGDGEAWQTQLIVQPVVAGGVVYGMDAEGVISAHMADDIGEIVWRSDIATLEDEPDIGGGGLAYANGVVYATTGYGSLIAIVAKDGSLLWRQEVDVPIRSAPTPAEDKIFAVSIDNQLIAHDARTGKPLWTHRGIKESALFLGTVTPTVVNGIVIAAYTSGELYALRAQDGTPLWSDTLIIPRRTYAAAALTGIDATPLVRDGIVYAVSNSGLMVANLLSNGRGMWDLEVAAYQTPWIAGEYVFILTAGHDLMAVHRRDKLVKWVTSLKAEDPKDDTAFYHAPIMVNNQLLVAGDAGEMLLFDPQNGQLKQRLEIPDGVRATPVVADGRLYLLDSDATLYQYQ